MSFRRGLIRLFLASLLSLSFVGESLAIIRCWVAQDFVDINEEMTSAQDAPHYSGGFDSFHSVTCPANVTQCYGVAMAITCPWIDYIQRKNGCYQEGYLEVEKSEAKRYRKLYVK